IEMLASKGIIRGYPDGTFRPDSNMTRADVSVVLAKSIGLDPAESNLTFKDSKDIPKWAEGFIQAIVDKGIIKGYDDGEFKPNRVLTRKEMVVMAVNAFNIEGIEIELPFADSDAIPNWAKTSVSKAFSSNIVKGYADNTFKPDKEVTRAEVCTIIAKCLELIAHSNTGS
ncbi:S-layer homology domain-containing protein, partial [Acetivibrio clariflavus]|uniref:S-layer homology domain-containing protein n=1 Tax=Acetivibrio clariflavus TaxID=288965 RepID=UPI0031F4CCDF